MKRIFTRGSSWLYALPALFLSVGIIACQWLEAAHYSVEPPTLVTIKKMEFSPDSKQLVIVTNNSRNALCNGRVYDVTTRAELCELALPRTVPVNYYDWLSWSGDSKRIVASTTAKIAIWDAQNGEVKADYAYRLANNSSYRGEIHFSPDGKTLIGEGIPPSIYDVATGERLNESNVGINRDAQIKSNEKLGLVADIEAWNETLEKELTGSQTRGKTELDKWAQYFIVRDAKTKRVIWWPKLGHPWDFDWAGDILYVRDNILPVSEAVPLQNSLRLWDGRTRQPLPTPRMSLSAGTGVFSFNSDRKTLVYVGYTGAPKTQTMDEPQVELVAYDYRANRVLWRIPLPESLENLQWSPDGKWLSAQGKSNAFKPRLYVYDRSGHSRFKKENASYFYKWSPDSKNLASVKANFVSMTKTLSRAVEIHRF